MMKKKILITSPILLAGAALVGIIKYRQLKKFKDYMIYVKENTKDVKRALILGDSVAKGHGSTTGGIANFLKEHLDQRFGDVLITNEGVLHLTSQGLAQKLINKKQYDQQVKDSNLVFINIGGNDLLQYFYKGGTSGVVKNFFKIRLEYIRNLEKIVRYIEKTNPSTVIVVNNLYNSLEEDYQYYGFTNMFINLWNVRRNKLPVIRVSTKELDRKKDLWADSVHPNEAGYEELSKLIIQELSNLIEGPKASNETD